MTERDDNPDAAVVVWIARLPELRDSLPALEALLDATERQRATRFHFPEDRARFIAGRGLLRLGLRRYAPEVPASLEITYSTMGRPLIPTEHGAPSFSISHTRDLVALAFTNNAQVGIDLEYMHPTLNIVELAERILSEEDFRTFQAFPHRERQLAFFRAWTRKEAYLKARGEGIATGLQDVSVSFSPEKTTTLADRRDTSAPGWRLQRVPVPDDYMGSLACDVPERMMKCFRAGMSKDDVVLEPLAS
jgi:4'-phosphopantetheinyl transferase